MCNENPRNWKERTGGQEDSAHEEIHSRKGVGRFTGVMKTRVLIPRIEFRKMSSAALQKG